MCVCMCVSVAPCVMCAHVCVCGCVCACRKEPPTPERAPQKQVGTFQSTCACALAQLKQAHVRVS